MDALGELACNHTAAHNVADGTSTMARQRQQQQSDPVVAAIERVLKTERDGTDELQQCQEQARQLLSEARAQAAAIATRTDAIISRLYSNYLRKVQQDIEQLTQSSLTSGTHDNAHDRAMLVRAVRRIAAKLAGGT